MPETQEQERPAQPPQAVEPEKVFLSWTAPSRPFKKRGRQFWARAISIAAIIGVVTFIAEGVMPVIALISLIFLYYVLSTVEPELIQISITNYGIKIANNTTYWDSLIRFWLSKRYENEVLIFETTSFPGKIELVINPSDKKKIKETVKRYLPEEEIPPSGIDKFLGYASQKIIKDEHPKEDQK